MAHANLKFMNGDREDGVVRQAANRSATPNADTMKAHAGESLGAITHRAYGANTIENQRRIINANSSLNGVINVPR